MLQQQGETRADQALLGRVHHCCALGDRSQFCIHRHFRSSGRCFASRPAVGSALGHLNHVVDDVAVFMLRVALLVVQD